MVRVPESIRFELTGRLAENVTAKDEMLFIRMRFARKNMTLNRVIECTGEGVHALSMDERATLADMATACSARGAMVIADDETFRWLAARRPDADIVQMRAHAVQPDADARYAGGVHTIDLGSLRPMLAHPGDPDRGIATDPTNGARVARCEFTYRSISFFLDPVWLGLGRVGRASCRFDP